MMINPPVDPEQAWDDIALTPSNSTVGGTTTTGGRGGGRHRGQRDRQQQQQQQSQQQQQQPTDAQLVVWRERERRQRTIRVLMMFLLMLLLMDGEEGNGVNHPNGANSHLRNRTNKKGGSSYPGHNGRSHKPLDLEVFVARQHQDALLRDIVVTHPRYEALIAKNGGKNAEADVRSWAEQQAEREKDEFDPENSANNAHSAPTTSGVVVLASTTAHNGDPSSTNEKASTAAAATSIIGIRPSSIIQPQRSNGDPEVDKKVFHYPWNTTGFYRGEWKRNSTVSSSDATPYNASGGNSTSSSTSSSTTTSSSFEIAPLSGNFVNGTIAGVQRLSAIELEPVMREIMTKRHHRGSSSGTSKHERVGVFVLPPQTEIWMRDDNNLTSLHWEAMTVDSAGRTYRPLHHNRLKYQQQQLLSSPTSGSGGSSSSGADTSAANVGTVIAAHDLINPSLVSSSLSSSRTSTSTVGSTNNRQKGKVTLTHDSGRAAFQIFSRSIPSMKELSLVDGFVKLYDSSSPGYSTRKDMLLRVRGVLIHAIGRISLVSNVDVKRSALVIDGPRTVVPTQAQSVSTSQQQQEQTQDRTDEAEKDTVDQLEKPQDESSDAEKKEIMHRRLLESLEMIHETSDLSQIRDDAFALFGVSEDEDNGDDEDEHLDQYDHSGSVYESLDFYDSYYEFDENEALAFGDLDEEVIIPGDAVKSSNAEDREYPDEVLDELVHLDLEAGASDESDVSGSVPLTKVSRRLLETPNQTEKNGVSISNERENIQWQKQLKIPPWSNTVLPFPFVKDDRKETIRKARTPAARRMPPREQLLEANAGICEFEINMDVQETEWSVGAWRNMLLRKLNEAKRLDPTSQTTDTEADVVSENKQQFSSILSPSRGSIRGPNTARNRAKLLQDQALVMTIIGTIESENCDFRAALNVTALRTDWEATTAKAINYSFYMMLVCLTQILVLLRQLLHSQSQSTAVRVSLLTVGWQTVIDALLCLMHIYLSLAMQPLFTAFASVAFFKLLIFCVIEMKYMAMVIQARNSSNGGQPTEVLRRQIAMLHLRFYVALFGTLLLMFYVGENYRVLYALTLYSFWIPQIILNIYTEAKTPLHNYYIYGMSISRLVAPIYIFSVQNNFLKEVYPDAPTDAFMCECVCLWVIVQAAVLLAQGKYGARFMIPARFLPPKFDYSRPLPASMLERIEVPASSTIEKTHRGEKNEAANSAAEPMLSSEHTHSSPSRSDRHTTSVTTRNRMRGNRSNRTEMPTTKVESSIVGAHVEEDQASPPVPPHHSLDCSICYDVIDVRNRKGYMLAPCDHIFHRDCLIQWMDVKMECPICRMELPAL